MEKTFKANSNSNSLSVNELGYTEDNSYSMTNEFSVEHLMNNIVED